MRVSIEQPSVFNPVSRVLSLTDFCKGLAILWIFLVHYKGEWFGWQGVHIFVVLSGFGLAYSCLVKTENQKIDWKLWFLRRARRILPVYWLAVLLSLPLLLAFQLSSSLSSSVVKTTLNLLLLTNFFESFKGGATGAFWYIPFIIGAYLIFPLLYIWTKKSAHTKGILLVLVATMAIEFFYRAIAIYYLDGQPISFDHKFLGIIPDSVNPLDQNGDFLFGFLQKRAPFGFISARIAEFTLGIIAAFLLVKKHQKMSRQLLNPYAGLAGVIIWLVGQALMYVGLWGWIFADFVIAAGLIIWVINLAYFFQQTAPSVFRSISHLGAWSYYIYLSHQPFTRAFQGIEIHIAPDHISWLNNITTHTLGLGLTVLSTFAISLLLKTFDQTQFPDLIIGRASRLLKIAN